MTEAHKSLAQRREILLAKSAVQREQLAALVAGAWPRASLPTGKNILALARKKPLLSGLAAVLAFLFFRHHRIFSLLAAGVVALKTWSDFSPWIQPVLNWLKSRRKKKR
ncbi:MAG: hypothetical protein LBM56_03395 [Burkholderiaceae bacterium]|jgi:hypothetical protein|nr:hypothetical protein [Burkholderiaceae bacterium]